VRQVVWLVRILGVIGKGGWFGENVGGEKGKKKKFNTLKYLCSWIQQLLLLNQQ